MRWIFMRIGNKYPVHCTYRVQYITESERDKIVVYNIISWLLLLQLMFESGLAINLNNSQPICKSIQIHLLATQPQ